MPKRRTVVAVFADSHAGSPSGVMLPQQFDGENGPINPTESQRVLAEIVGEYIEKVNSLRKVNIFRQPNDRLIVVHLGDATEGKHHNNTQVMTNLISEHEAIHIAWMDDCLQRLNFSRKNGDLLVYVAGTPAHVGSQGESEHRIGKDLEALPYREPKVGMHDGRYVWPRWVSLINGVKFDMAHHPPVGVGGRYWTRTSSLRSYLADVYLEHLDTARQVPRYWLRAHKHVYIHAQHEGRQGTVDGFIMPALQTKTEFAYRIAAGKLSTIGAWWAVVEADGTTYWDVVKHEFDEDQMQTL